MRIAIDILKEQVKISKERLKTAHYPISAEPFVKQKIKECEDAINVLDSERINREIISSEQ